MKVERDVHIAAPPEEAYETVMDPSRLGDWVSIHRGFKEDPPDRLERGSKLVQRLKVAGQGFTVRWTVTEADRPDQVTWEGAGPAGTKAKVVYGFGAEDGGTRFSYVNEYELPGGAAGRMAGKAVARAAGREVDRSLGRLKALLEA